MSKTNKYIAVSIVLFLFIFATHYETLANAQKYLTGYIEVFNPCKSERFHFETASIEILSSDCRIHDYALTIDGVKAIVDASDEHYQLVSHYGTPQEKVIKSGDGIIEMAISPDSKKLAYLYWKRTKELFQVNGKLFVMNIDGTNDRKVIDNPVIRSRPSWFPDSHRVVISTFDHEILIIDIDTRKKEKIIDFGIMPSVSPDGSKIAYLSHNVTNEVRNKIIAYDKLSEEQYSEVINGPKKSDYDEVMTKYFMQNSIYIYDMETKQTTRISEGLGIEEPVLWSQDSKYIAFTDRKNIFAHRYVKLINIQTREISKIKTSFGGMLKGWVYVDSEKNKKH